MKHPNESAIDQLLEEQRRAKCSREDSLGPIVAAVAMLRESCSTLRLVLDELETTVGFHLELLDHVLVTRHGSRWWEHLQVDDVERGS
jgi:hypothetical protein